MPLLISSRMTSAGLTASRSASSLTVMVAGSSMGPRSRGSATWTGPPPNAPSRRGGLRGPRRPRVPLLLLATGSSFGVRCGHVGWVVVGDGVGERKAHIVRQPGRERSRERSAGDCPIEAAVGAAHVGAAAGSPASFVDPDRSDRRADDAQQVSFRPDGPAGDARPVRDAPDGSGGRGPAYDDTSSAAGVASAENSLQLSLHRLPLGRRRLSWRARRASAWQAPRPRSRWPAQRHRYRLPQLRSQRSWRARRASAWQAPRSRSPRPPERQRSWRARRASAWQAPPPHPPRVASNRWWRQPVLPPPVRSRPRPSPRRPTRRSGCRCASRSACAASRAFCPSLPIASESCRSGTITLAVRCSSSMSTDSDLGRAERVGDEGAGSSIPRNDVDLLAVQLVDDVLDADAAHGQRTHRRDRCRPGATQTATFERLPASRAIALISTVPLKISGTSSSNRRLQKALVRPADEDLRTLGRRRTSSAYALTFCPIR